MKTRFPLPVDCQHAPRTVPLARVMLLVALALATGFFTGAIVMGEATLRLHTPTTRGHE